MPKTPSTPKVYAVGETVFDIIFKDFHPEAAKPGGSAFNAMITLGRLGIPGSFISEVGNDRVGNYILQFLADNGVDNEYVVMFEDGKSALSLAFLNASSDAEYDFYKDYPNQRLNEVMPQFGPDDYLLFGSFYGLNPVLRPQITSLLDAANESNALVYYDPNFRSSHLASLEQLKSIIEENVRVATIVRASDEDMQNIYGVASASEAWEKIAPRCAYFVYTANAQGVDLFTPSIHLHVDVDRIEPVSTVGAGDTFNAGILYSLYTRGVTRRNLDQLGEAEWRDILQTAAGFSREVCLSYDNYVGKREPSSE
ncbi:MAG: carbohydrate kinase [Bacteroidales bacterium]|nr:carbohydrate kinase [Bacteroidales bacterium]MDT8431451.1 carbohydrate kinase [Bacteroidales bacterium]